MILPQRKDINVAKSLERKREIDEGMAIARKVDAMRELKLEQERHIKEWKEVTITAIQSEISQFQSERDVAEREAIEAKKRRDALLVPLTADWLAVEFAKEELTESKDMFLQEKEMFEIKVSSFQKKEKRLEQLVLKSADDCKVAEKERQDAEKIKARTVQEYETARVERETQEETYKKSLRLVTDKAKEYEVALTTIGIREQAVLDKESDLNEREKALKDKYETLERTLKRIKK